VLPVEKPEHLLTSFADGGVGPHMVRLGHIGLQGLGGHAIDTADAVAALQVRDVQHINACLGGIIEVPALCQLIDGLVADKGGGGLPCCFQDLLQELVQPEVTAFGGAALKELHLFLFRKLKNFYEQRI